MSGTTAALRVHSGTAMASAAPGVNSSELGIMRHACAPPLTWCSVCVLLRLAASMLAVANKTKAGCKCKKIWGYASEGGLAELYLNGECGSPDSDAQGAWCFTEANTCVNSPAGPKTERSPDEWDYC